MNEKVKQAIENVKNIKVGTMVLNDLFGEDLKTIETALNKPEDYEIQNTIFKEHEKELIAEQHRLFDLAKEQENELNELKEFVKTISSHTDINRLTLKGENEITISYFSEKWHKKQFDLFKKVVEKYGK